MLKVTQLWFLESIFLHYATDFNHFWENDDCQNW